MAALGMAPAHAEGNYGTLKVHSVDSSEETESNEPKVCGFDLEGFGFEEGFSGYLKFEVQGGDAPTGYAPPDGFEVGPANADGYFISGLFNVNVAGATFLADGHYKVTVYGKFNAATGYEDVKSKSKVFKVDCPPTTPTVPTASDVCEPASGTTNDRIMIPTDIFFTYTIDGAAVMAGAHVASGTTHKVMAVPKPGVEFADGAAREWTFTFTKVACVAATPPAPVVATAPTQANFCEPVSGPTNDRIHIPNDANFTYTVNGAAATGSFVASGTSYTVAAVAKAGVTVQPGSTTQWTFTFTKVSCADVAGASAVRVKGAVKKIDKCARAGDAFMAKKVRGVTYRVHGKVIREGVWLRARTQTVRVRAVPSSRRFTVAGPAVWTLRFSNRACAAPPEVLPATGA